MFEPPLDLSAARVLLSNDDGIHAPGLKRLEKIARELCREVWVVAPETEQSAASHSLTLRRPLRLRKLSPRRFAVDGTPTDCVLLAVNRLLKGKRPDVMLSGINLGGNMGEDMTYSGTIAAAMEATLLGIPAIAFSQYTDEIRERGRVRWEVAERFAPEVIEKAVTAKWPRNLFINVNFPAVDVNAVAGIEITREGRRKIGDDIREGTDPRGEAYYWIGAQRDSKRYAKGSDLDAVRRGAVSVTPLSMDLTHGPSLKTLRQAFR
jgi:5'-nucleotidase